MEGTGMEYEQKNVKNAVVSKNQLQFYKACYGKFGYSTVSQEKKGFHYKLRMKRDYGNLSHIEEMQLRLMEEKFRMIELIERKKYGFQSLLFNLLIHAVLFCVQSFIFYCLKLKAAHPAEMLQAGMGILQIILLIGMCMKFQELFRWNVTQGKLKEEAAAASRQIPAVIDGGQTYYISVLFTRGIGLVSNLIYYTTGRQYTHAAIGMGKQTQTFYSFNYKGFREEHPAHRRLRKGKKNSLCYQFQVSEKEYIQLENMIGDCLKEKAKYKYNFAGTIFCILHIYLPFKRRYDYFCSEFVSEQLRHLHSFRLKKPARMYLPNCLAKTLSRQPNLYRVLVDEI